MENAVPEATPQIVADAQKVPVVVPSAIPQGRENVASGIERGVLATGGPTLVTTPTAVSSGPTSGTGKSEGLIERLSRPSELPRIATPADWFPPVA